MLTTFILKLIAMVTMTIDHVGLIMMANSTFYTPMRVVGRIAFLLYAFLVAEGFFHIRERPGRTRNQIIKLTVLTIVSEIAYDLMEHGVWFYPSDQSVMPTLLLGFVGLAVMEKFKWEPAAVATCCGGFSLLSLFIHSNYRFAGVLLIYAFYAFTSSCRDMSFGRRFVVLSVIITAYWLLHVWVRVDFGDMRMFMAEMRNVGAWALGHYLAMILVAAYDGRQGLKNKAFDLLYSAYYPLHMLAIWGIGLLH